MLTLRANRVVRSACCSALVYSASRHYRAAKHEEHTPSTHKCLHLRNVFDGQVGLVLRENIQQH